MFPAGKETRPRGASIPIKKSEGSVMQKLKRIFINFEEVVGGTALLIMTSFVFINVFSRIFFKKSFAALDELSYLLFAYVIFVGGSSLYKRYGHGVIDLVVRMLPKWMQAAISCFVSALLVFVCGLTFVLSSGYCVQAWTRRSQTLHIPQSFTAFALVLGFFFMTIHSLFLLKNVITKKDYFHEVPIYDGLFTVDSVEDMVADSQFQHEEESDGKGGSST